MFRPEFLVVLYQQTLQTDFTEFCEKWALAEEPINNNNNNNNPICKAPECVDGIQW